MDERTELAKELFLNGLGDVVKAQKEFADRFHRELNADVFISQALGDCHGYFGTPELPSVVPVSLIASLALARYRQLLNSTGESAGLKSETYTEGSVSKSETYFTPDEENAEIDNLLKPYSRYRVVKRY